MRALRHILGILVVVATVLTTVHWKLSRLHGDVGHPDIVPEDKQLYDIQVASGLLHLDAAGRVLVPTRDQPLREAAELRASGKVPGERQKEVWGLINSLYATPAGAAVLREIEIYNSSAVVAAIRDSRDMPGRWTLAGPKMAGDIPSQWSASDGYALPLTAETGLERMLPQREAIPGMSDWLVVSGRAKVAFHTVIVGPAPGFTVQYVGREAEASLSNGGVLRVGDGRIEVPTSGDGRHVLTVIVTAEENKHRDLRGGALLAQVAGPPVWEERHGSAPNPNVKDPHFRIVSRDGDDLWDGVAGRPTSIAVDGGILPVIGFGNDDREGLSGMMARRRVRSDGDDLQLTLHSRVQVAANHALGRLNALYGADDRFAQKRRAEFLVMNPENGAIWGMVSHPAVPAGLHVWDLENAREAESGAFAMQAGRRIDAFNAPGSTFKPFTALMGLAQLTATPGDRQLEAMIVGQRLNAAGRFEALGLNGHDRSWRPPGGSKIDNFRDQRMDRSLGKPVRDSACPGADAAPSGQFGLIEATRDSMNSYFMVLAHYVEMRRARQLDSSGANGGLNARRRAVAASGMAEMMAALGLGQGGLDLLANGRSHLGSGGRSFITLSAESDLLSMAQGKLDARVPDVFAMSAIGQRLFLSPMDVAVLYAAAATGRRVIPHLLSRWNGSDLDILPPVDLGIARRDLLHAALKAPPEVGTAAQSMGRPGFDRNGKRNDDGRSEEERRFLAAASCFTFGKTGTAEVVKEQSIDAAWMAGWIEPDGIFPVGHGLPRRLVFVCHVSHTHGPVRLGGQVCGPLVAQWLLELRKVAP